MVTGKIGRNIEKIIESVSSWFLNIYKIQTIFNTLDTIPKLYYENGKKLENFRGNIKLENISFSYPQKPTIKVLKNLSLEIKEQSVVALTGGSGSGKTTLVEIIQRIYDIDEGRITVDGVDVKEIDIKWMHQHVGIVT
jgi:ATP-binding cassette subfamily B (MDR/TAP) protein 1